MAKGNSTAQRALRVLKKRGPGEVARRAVRHYLRKMENRRYVARTRPGAETLAAQRAKTYDRRILFSVAVPLYNTPADMLAEMIGSVRAQSYQAWELCLADGSDENHPQVGEYCRAMAAEDARVRYEKLERNGGISENTNACLAMARGDYIALLDHDDLLMPNALAEVREAIEKTGADFLYSDEMIFRSPKTSSVIGIRMKPAFSPDSLLANNYICHLSCFSRELLAAAGPFRSAYDGSQDHDMILRLTGQARGIAHIAKTLYLWRASPTSTAADINTKQYAIDAGRSAVRDFLRTRRGVEARVDSTEVFPTMYRVRYPLEGSPRVRVVVDATREQKPAGERIRRLREKAGWEQASWVLLNGIGESDDQMPWLERVQPAERGRGARWARAAAGEEEYLLFLDGVPGDADEGWLREMLSLAAQPHVGAVGPKILFERGDVRMAGIVLGMGPAGLAGRLYYRGDGESEDAFFGQLAVTEDVSILGDCLLVSRRKYEQAGGFASEYGDALFEADFCLRLLEKGYYNVYTPHARMWLGKAKDTRFDLGREYASWDRDAETFRRRNGAALERGDPYYNPNLSRKHENWRIAIPKT